MNQALVRMDHAFVDGLKEGMRRTMLYIFLFLHFASCVYV